MPETAPGQDDAPPKGLAAYIQHLLKGRESLDRLGPSPYRGLRFFDVDSTSLLTSREGAAQEILKRFEKTQTVVAVGGSGSGKSSLVRGRVLAEIEAGLHRIGDRDGAWYAVVVRPATTPKTGFIDAVWRDLFADRFARARAGADAFHDGEILERLLGRLYHERGVAPPDDLLDEAAARALLTQDLDRDPRDGVHAGFAIAQNWVDQLDRAYTEVFGEDGDGDGPRAPANLLILVDQFEEIFRRNVDPAEADALHAMIRFVHKHKPPGVFLTLVMRSEDLHRCTQVPDLADFVNKSLYLVKWLDETQLKEAIALPAARVLRDWNIPFTRSRWAPYDDAVVTRLAAGVEAMKRPGVLSHPTDHLPLFQHGLSILWQIAVKDWKETGATEPRVTLDHLDAVKDLAGSPRDSETAWFSDILNSRASHVMGKAEAALADALGARRSEVDPHSLIRAALCEMASLEENQRYHREFVSAAKVIDRRFPDRRFPDRRDGRDRTRRAELARALEAGLDAFVARGLLVCDATSKGKSYDVTHEALLRNWTDLGTWVMHEDRIVKAAERALHPEVQAAADTPTSRAGASVRRWLRHGPRTLSPSRGEIVIRSDDMPVLGDLFRVPLISALLRPGRSDYARTFTREWLAEALKLIDPPSGEAAADQAPLPIDDRRTLVGRLEREWTWQWVWDKATLALPMLAVLLMLGSVLWGVQQTGYASTNEMKRDEHRARGAFSAMMMLANRNGGVEDAISAAHAFALAYDVLRDEHQSLLDQHPELALSILPHLLRAHADLDRNLNEFLGEMVFTVHHAERATPDPVGAAECGVLTPRGADAPQAAEAGPDAPYGLSSAALAFEDPQTEIALGDYRIRIGWSPTHAFQFMDRATGAAIPVVYPENARFDMPIRDVRLCLSPAGDLLTVSHADPTTTTVYRLQTLSVAEDPRRGRQEAMRRDHLMVWRLERGWHIHRNDRPTGVPKVIAIDSGDGINALQRLTFQAALPMNEVGQYDSFFFAGRKTPRLLEGRDGAGVDPAQWSSRQRQAPGWTYRDREGNRMPPLSAVEACAKVPEPQAPPIEHTLRQAFELKDLPKLGEVELEINQIRSRVIQRLAYEESSLSSTASPMAHYSVSLVHSYRHPETRERQEDRHQLGGFVTTCIVDFAAEHRPGDGIVFAFETAEGQFFAMETMDALADAKALLHTHVLSRYRDPRYQESQDFAHDRLLESCKIVSCPDSARAYIEAELAPVHASAGPGDGR